MKLFFAARAAALLLVFMAPSGANSQSAPANAPLKEVHVGATAFSLANPTPSWVEPTAMSLLALRAAGYAVTGSRSA